MEQLMISVMRMAYVPVNMVLVVTSVMNALMDYMVSPIAKIAHAIHKVQLVLLVTLLDHVFANQMLLEMNVTHVLMVISIFPIA